MHVSDDFSNGFDRHWTQVTTGGGRLELSRSVLHMAFDGAQADKYTDAQIDDYTMLSKSQYLWRPPLRMTVRARASHPAATADATEKTTGILRGTAGFGFWNKPFTMQGQWFTLPESVWFFYSAPPSNMALAAGIPGWGWKAQVVHASRPGILAHAVPLAGTAAYARLTGDTKPAARWMQRFTGTSEALITQNLTEWHVYKLEWLPKTVKFWVDDELILKTKLSPTKPLGFVAWLDNEFAIATPDGKLRFGKTKTGPQWLDVDSIKIEAL